MEKNPILRVKNNLKLENQDLANLLGLARGDKGLITLWEQNPNKIPKKILHKLEYLPTSAPFKFKGKAKFKFIDLFAGIGGIRLGFLQEGGECVLTSEWDLKAQRTYRVNYGEQPTGDITKIKEEEVPNFDVLLAGFPCQAFSHAGKKEGFNDTRGTLFFDVARILKAKRPASFLLENVKGLISHDKGRTFSTIIKTLKDLNYEVFYKVLLSKEFGVPQNRQRIIIVGFDKSKFAKNFDFNKYFNFPEAFKKVVKVGDILESNKEVDSKYTLSDRLWQGHQNRRKKHAEKGNGFGYSVFTKDSPHTNTISARYYKDGSEALIDQSDLKKNPRKLTPRECARLQGYPENFLLPGSDNDMYKQFGNSVTVPLMNAVAKRILLVLKHVKK